MTLEQLQAQGWFKTDGSSSTLQFGRKINDTTWEYRQWVDGPFDKKFSAEEKINLWDHHMWQKDIIDVNKGYTENEVQYYLDPYGYEILHWIVLPNEKFTLIIKDELEVYDRSDSIQLACECIFEQTN